MEKWKLLKKSTHCERNMKYQRLHDSKIAQNDTDKNYIYFLYFIYRPFLSAYSFANVIT